MSEKESYKQAFKATSLFGIVQVFIILINLVRSKLIAVLLGTSGYGINGLFQNPMNLIGSLTGLGIGFSAVRDVAVANTEDDATKISRTIQTLKRWSWTVGIAGTLTVIGLSPLLSRWSFKNSDYTISFILLSVCLLLSALSSGQTAVLQGTRRLKDATKSGFSGALLGLVFSIPLYYFWGIKGIVPAFILSAAATLLATWHFSRKVKLVPSEISYKESFTQGIDMVKLGIMVTLSNLIGQVVSYLIILLINEQSGKEAVGLYTAGWSMTNQYVGLIFAAMGADYFPRLSGLQSDKSKMEEAVNHQAEIAVLIIAPLIILFLAILPWIIQILFTEEFIPVISFVRWIITGMLFKAASWTLGFILIAKGDTKLFFIIELTTYLIQLACYATGYHFGGLEGIGIAFVVVTFFYFIEISIIVKKKYKIGFNKDFQKLFLIQFALCISCFLIIFFQSYPLGYFSGGLLFVFSAIYSLRRLDKKADLRQIILSKIKSRK